MNIVLAQCTVIKCRFYVKFMLMLYVEFSLSIDNNFIIIFYNCAKEVSSCEVKMGATKKDYMSSGCHNWKMCLGLRENLYQRYLCPNRQLDTAPQCGQGLIFVLMFSAFFLKFRRKLLWYWCFVIVNYILDLIFQGILDSRSLSLSGRNL